MGLLPCEDISRRILPAFRAMLARRLVGRYGLTQMEVASMLGVSQPSINYYLSSKRGRIKDKKSVKELERLADELAEKMARGIIRSEEIFIEFCKICSRRWMTSGGPITSRDRS